MKKLINGVLIDMTAEEITARQAEENQAVIDKQARLDAETIKANKLASANTKLKALGLTDAEIEALKN